MIDKYLRGLPYSLRQPMQREYEAKVRDLARWRTRSRSARNRSFLDKSDALAELIALGIYYRYIVAPLSSSAEFLHRLRSNDIVAVRIGGRELGVDFQSKIEAGVAKFNSILRNYDLAPQLFAESDVARFVLRLVRLEERRSE